MGFFSSIFGGKKDYPQLDAGSNAAQQMKGLQQQLKTICEQTADPIEVIPTSGTIYIFLGSPPKRFAISWIEKDGSIHSFKSLIEEKGVPQIKIERLIGNVANAYRQSKDATRFSYTIDSRAITVTQADSLADNLKQVIDEAIS